MKAGWRTSEFWMALGAAVIPVLNKYFGLHIPTDQIIAVAGVIASYVISRGVVKAKTG